MEQRARAAVGPQRHIARELAVHVGHRICWRIWSCTGPSCCLIHAAAASGFARSFGFSHRLLTQVVGRQMVPALPFVKLDSPLDVEHRLAQLAQLLRSLLAERVDARARPPQAQSPASENWSAQSRPPRVSSVILARSVASLHSLDFAIEMRPAPVMLARSNPSERATLAASRRTKTRAHLPRLWWYLNRLHHSKPASARLVFEPPPGPGALVPHPCDSPIPPIELAPFSSAFAPPNIPPQNACWPSYFAIWP